MTTAMETNWVPQDTLGARIVVLRHSMGMSRREFSKLTSITENALQGIEEGRSPHKLPEKIQAIHRATGVSREWLMWGGPLNERSPHPDGPDGGSECPQPGSNRRPADYKSQDSIVVPFLVAA